MNSMFKQVITVSFSAILLSTVFAPGIIAAPYGSESYGVGNYNVGELTPTPTSTPTSSGSGGSSSSSSGGGSPGPQRCSNQAPDSVPDLFQINAKKNTLTLFFTPSSGNKDRYYVSYGLETGNYQYGLEFMNSENGVISIDINDLRGNTVYYFKVRAGNGCQPGEWSNELGARTGQYLPTYRWSSVSNIITARIIQTVNPSKIIKVETTGPQKQVAPNQPQQEVKVEPKVQEPQKQAAQPSTPQPAKQNSDGIWQWLLNLFN